MLSMFMQIKIDLRLLKITQNSHLQSIIIIIINFCGGYLPTMLLVTVSGDYNYAECLDKATV